MATNATEFTVQKNTAPVSLAGPNSSLAEMDKIASSASAQVAHAREESARVDTQAVKGNAPPSQNIEAKVYGDLAMEATGVKLVSSVLEFVDARLSEKSQEDGFFGGVKPRTIEEDTHRAKHLQPGVHRAEVEEKHYDGAADILKTTHHSKNINSDGVLSRSNIAVSSFKEQEKEALKTWDIPEKQNFAGVKFAKEVTFEMRNASEKALESVVVARQQYGATMHKINQIAPGMGMASGPARPYDLLRDAEEAASSSQGVM